jgi:hypothetical protein
VNIFGNRILNYKGNGMRLNGSGINVKNNFLNYEGLCNDQNNTINGKYVGTAFKSHFLTNSTIENNCIKNSNAGISLESWGDMSNIIISKNIIHQATNALYATNVGNGYYRDIKISRNQFYGTKNYGIALRGTITSFNNQINSNTLSSMSSMEGPLITLQRQENLYFDNNWIQGEARSINWNYLWINRVSNSIFKRSVIKSHSGKDKSFAGIYITSIDSKNNKFDNITFKNLNPAVLDLGVNNTFTNINYK